MSLLLALALLTSVAPPLYPFHVAAQTAAIDADGWQATIQVRPYSDTPIWAWAGGYLSDGTFVQSGILQPGPAGGPTAFVWFDTPGSVPTYLPLTGTYPAWYTFRAELEDGEWQFTVGEQVQLVTRGPALSVLVVDAEPWLEGWGSFPTQAFRHIKVRANGTWRVPAMTFGVSPPICGTAEIKPTPGLNLVIRSAVNAACYRRLSP